MLSISVQYNHLPRCKLIRQKMAMGQAEQDPDLLCLASNVLGKVQSHLCLGAFRGICDMIGEKNKDDILSFLSDWLER